MFRILSIVEAKISAQVNANGQNLLLASWFAAESSNDRLEEQ